MIPTAQSPSKTFVGLTSAEAKIRLLKYGANTFEEQKLFTALKNIAKIVTDPMGIMLLALAVIYWFMGNLRDSTLLFIFYIPIVAVDVILEMRSQKALGMLKKTLKSKCHVIRDGETTVIPSHQLVPGDLLLLEEGQMIPADGKFLESSNISINEASVTGESIPIEKEVGHEAISGTEVISGNAIVEIIRTGSRSQIGTIAKSLEGFRSSKSPLLEDIYRLVKFFFSAAILVALFVFGFDLWNQRNFSQSLISALTLAMAAMPEEFPLVFTIYLSMAAYRLSKKGILVKSLPAVEGLARVDIICTDKTGTLTEGKFRFLQFLTESGEKPLNEDTATFLIFSCEPKATDAMEAAIFERVREFKNDLPEQIHSQWTLKTDYPFDLKNKYMSHVWQKNSSEDSILAAKGSIEGILAICEPSNIHEKILAIAHKSAAEGMRILALAGKKGKFSGDRKEDEKNLQLIGILCFTDPVRVSVIPAVQYCKNENIEIKMLTGDHLLTAHAIADKIGLAHESDQLFSGSELEKLSESDRFSAYKNGKIFARLKPDQKLDLVKFLKSIGKTVAMTGDGINDAPALKLADVGISMGEKATDIARSTAQIILMKNDFAGIASSVQEGRNVLESLRQGFGYLLGFHLPIIFLALFQSFSKTQILLPIHIILLELIVHPISAFVFDNSPATKNHRQKFFSPTLLKWSIFRGAIICAISVILFYKTENNTPTFIVLFLALSNLGLILGEKGGFFFLFSSAKKRKLFLSFSLLTMLSIFLAFVPFLRELFSLSAISAKEFLLLLALALSVAIFAQRKELSPSSAS